MTASLLIPKCEKFCFVPFIQKIKWVWDAWYAWIGCKMFTLGKEDLLENIKSKNSKLLTNSEFRVQTQILIPNSPIWSKSPKSIHRLSMLFPYYHFIYMIKWDFLLVEKNEHDIYLFQYLKFIGAVREGEGGGRVIKPVWVITSEQSRPARRRRWQQSTGRDNKDTAPLVITDRWFMNRWTVTFTQKKLCHSVKHTIV